MDYKIVVTKDAEEDLDKFIQYLIFEKKSMQAAQNVLDDYDANIDCLKYVAGIKNFIKENPNYRTEGIHDLRGLNAEKITGTEADFEKIKSIFCLC